jgi:hypothetical protein
VSILTIVAAEIVVLRLEGFCHCGGAYGELASYLLLGLFYPEICPWQIEGHPGLDIQR